MMQNYLDAMSLCKWFGYPDFFITITCNPKWPEVKRFLKDTTLKAEDRPDILCRLFKIKLDAFVKDLKDKSILGKVLAVVYTVEFQKRGLPHAHVCLFMHPDDKVPTVDKIDPVICAEIPDEIEDPELYLLVKEHMMHGPCGADNFNSPCMIDGKCSKKFPKKFLEHTSIDGNGFPMYRRRDSGKEIYKYDVRMDNRNVVPYNKTLLKRYQAHINVEWCNQAGSIKYLFKYINKGPDRATLLLKQGNNDDPLNEDTDEIKEYYDCRYV
ncbi:putative helitron helicase-like domain-containing protein [Helianthus annuus]|nr:putative helitron helicase-like domain-containing protein [Helianthus annuus]